jgi:hypothetical protein
MDPPHDPQLVPTPAVVLLQAPLHWMVPQLELHAPPTLAVVLLQAPLHVVVPQPELHGCR